MKEKLFFLTSKKVAKRLTDVFDFVWPTAAAIWNLRWQVAGLVNACPDITEEELLGRFVTGSGIRGANLKRSCINNSWDEQQSEFSRFFLFEFCALYEAWCEGCVQELGSASGLSKDLQFPTSTTSRGMKGVGRAISTINATKSADLAAALYGPLSSNKKYSLAHLEELLVCYRYFKELRNALIHAGGSASSAFIQAETAYRKLTPASLGVKEVPAINGHAPGSPMTVSLRGVVGFGEIVLRLVCTLDIELSQSEKAVKSFVSRWKELHGNSPVLIASNPKARLERIIRLVRKLDFPTPNATPQFDAWLTAKRLVS